MNALQCPIYGWPDRRLITKNPKVFVRPNQLPGGYIPAKAAGVTERLRLLAIRLAATELLRRDFLLRNVYGGADVILQLLVFDNRSTDAANIPNLTVGSHDSLGSIEARSFHQDSLDQVCHEFAILWVDAIQVFLNSRRCASWLEAVNPK
ncbi:MAG: hypothetical protein Udaeo2_11730 [Candidatus Udaeobacter sp.]|nr:MAG: hypothetical protein Udaeo2_11730 [Candidatus Udaeobacter sp.]